MNFKNNYKEMQTARIQDIIPHSPEGSETLCARATMDFLQD